MSIADQHRKSGASTTECVDDTLSAPPQSPRRSRWAVSLRTLLVVMTAVFVIGYQQFQIRRLRRDLDAVREAQSSLAKAPPPQRFKVLINRSPSGNSGSLRFPVEVERAMMGDAINIQLDAPRRTLR